MLLQVLQALMQLHELSHWDMCDMPALFTFNVGNISWHVEHSFGTMYFDYRWQGVRQNSCTYI